MPYEITRYTGGGQLARRTNAELARVDNETELILHKMRSVAFTGEYGITRAVSLQLAQKAAEEMAPNGSEHYAAMVRASTLEIESLINQLGYRLR